MSTPTQWTPELFDAMSADYLARMEAYPEEERANYSMEVVNELAKENDVTANGFRMKLSKAGLYIKKVAAAKTSATSGEKASSGGSRTSKAQAHQDLIAAFSDAGLDSDFLDMAIVDKLTGKAAAHLAEAIRKITK